MFRPFQMLMAANIAFSTFTRELRSLNFFGDLTFLLLIGGVVSLV